MYKEHLRYISCLAVELEKIPLEDPSSAALDSKAK